MIITIMVTSHRCQRVRLAGRVDCYHAQSLHVKTDTIPEQRGQQHGGHAILIPIQSMHVAEIASKAIR